MYELYKLTVKLVLATIYTILGLITMILGSLYAALLYATTFPFFWILKFLGIKAASNSCITGEQGVISLVAYIIPVQFYMIVKEIWSL